MSTNTKSRTGRRPGRSEYVLAILVAVYALQYLDRQIVVILAEPLKRVFTLSDSQLGLLSGLIYTAPYSLLLIPAGLLADRTSRRNLLTAALAVWSLLTFLTGLTGGTAQLMMVRTLIGAAEAVNGPTSVSLLTDYYDKHARITAMAIYFNGPAIASVVGFAFVGAIAQAYGWRVAFFGAGLPGLLLAALIFLTLREPARDGAERLVSEKAPRVTETFRFILEQKSLLHMMLALLLSSLAMSSHIAWAAPLFMRVHGLTLSQTAYALSIAFGLSTFIGQLFLGFLIGRMAARDVSWVGRITGGCAGAAGVFMIASVLAPTSAVAIGCLACWAALNAGLVGPSMGAAPSLVPPRMRGVASACITFAINLIGAGIGPLAVGVLSDAFTPWAHSFAVAWALVVISMFQFWAMAHYLISSKWMKHDVEKVERLAERPVEADDYFDARTRPAQAKT